MGDVYRARDHDLHRDVAIKFLPERFASDATRLGRFALEARTASSLNHPNIVTIHEIGQTDGRPYIVMEYVDGTTLRRLLQRGHPLAAKQTLDIGAQLADGLAKAHAAHVVHRDLKPENVMVTKDGFVKILDFGLAKLRVDREEVQGVGVGDGTSETVTDLWLETAGGVLLGTASYMAPEQARGLPADYRSDQFALGSMLYEMATGRKAFQRESVVQTLSAIIDDEPQSISDINPSFPAPARWAIERCLAKDPGDRYASTLELAYELRGIRERTGEATAASSVRPTGGASAPRRLPRLRVAIGAAVALTIAFLTPAIRERALRLIHPAPFVDDVRLAVVLNSDSVAPPDLERLQSLASYVAIRLAELNRFRQSFSVVPASEVRENQVRSAHDANRRVGANYAVGLTVRRAGQALVVSASLEDAEHVRVLGGGQRTFPADQVSEEGVVDLILGILPLRLPPDAHSAWASEASGVPEARSLFAKGLNQTPYQTGAIALVKYDQEQSLQTAIESFNRAIELDPRYADAYARLGEAHLLLYRLTRRPDDLALAERNATKARDIDDARPAAWITLGMIHTQQRKFAEAEQEFGSAIARAPRSSPAYRELARMEQQRQQPDKAEANYRKAIELKPDDWSNYSYLGGFLLAAQRLPEAEQAWLTASRKAPDNARVWSNLGALYFTETPPGRG
jgi:serine/threonine protein kinase/Tfp pilus assembly protein PilF